MERWGFRAGARGWRLAARALVISALVAVLAVLAVGADAGTTAPRFASVQRAPAAPIGGQSLGAPAASATQSGYVVLKPRDERALQSFITSVTTRHSSEYHQYLRAGQFESRFGPASSTIAAVRSTLVGDGLQITSVTRDGLMIGFSGTTGEVESAFDTSLERYRSAAGITGEQTTKAVSLPTGISGDVAAVVGLNTLVHPEAALVRPAKSAYAEHAAARKADITSYPSGAPDPCTDASDAASGYGGLTDDQIANAYGAWPLYGTDDTGQGVSIGVYELEPFSSSDVEAFDQCYFGNTQGAAMAAGINVVNVDGGQPSGSGSGEAALDIEDVSAMAPGAQIDVYEAPNTSAGSLDEYARMVDDDTDQIITSSWGLCEQDLELADPGAQQAENYIFEQAAAQGQTVLSAAGDTGDDTCNEVRSVPAPTDQNPLSVDDPASQPYVIGVGGTTIQDADPAHYDETAWNDGAEWGGGGGGFSMSWVAPSWQQTAPGFPMPLSGNADYTNANAVEVDAASQGISQQNLTPGFCASNPAIGSSSNDANGNPLPNEPCRTVPDVSADADEFTGAVTIYYGGSWSTIGGTSSATPIWAAMLALTDASSYCTGTDLNFSKSPTDTTTVAKPDIGFSSPLLYAVADNPTEYAQSFHDITVGNNDVYGFDDGHVFPATTGYDLATGLGSPMLSNSSGEGLAQNLCRLAGTNGATPTVAGLDPTVGSVAGGNAVIVTGTGFTDVRSVTIGSDVLTLPSPDVTVNSSSQMTITMPAGTASLAPPTASQTDLDTGTTYVAGGSANGQDGSGLANIVVTLDDGTSSPVYANDPTNSAYDQYTYADEPGSTPVPSVSSVSPYAGVNTGGQPITIYGSGFASGDTVTVGGAAATDVTVVSPWQITAKTPADPTLSSANCLTEGSASTPGSLEYELSTVDGESSPGPQETTDICQTEVVVTDSSNNSSATTAPLPTYLGALPATNQDGLLEVPEIAGVQYELSPVADEYDYVPAPTVSNVAGVTTVDGFANADPDTYGTPTVLQITGTGLNYQTLNWFSFGDPTQAGGQDTAYPTYADGTTDILAAPADPNLPSSGLAAGSDAAEVPITAFSMGGSSGYDSHCSNGSADCVAYAGLPRVTGVSSSTNSDPDITQQISPDTGGANLTITGSGLDDVSGPLEFVDAEPPALGTTPFSAATQYSYNVQSDSSITTQTVSQNPALVDTIVCSDSGCSATSSADQILLYPPGDPVITSIQTASGPPLGGTLVTINGDNLGCVTSVSFGSTVAESFSNTEALLDCGSTSQLTVVAPPGTAGQSVPITLTTVESDVTDEPTATSLNATSGPTEFTYDPVNPSVTDSVSFGSVDLASSRTRTVTITNPSAATQPLYAGGSGDPDPASITGADAGDFTIANDGCSGQTLNPGQSCTIQVSFAPTQPGSRSATLGIPWNNSASIDPSSATSDFTVALSGTGAEPTNTVTNVLTNTVTTPGTTATTPGTTTTITKTVTCTITVTSKWVTVKLHGKKKREFKKVTTRSKGCPSKAKRAGKPKKKHTKPSRKKQTKPSKRRRQ